MKSTKLKKITKKNFEERKDLETYKTEEKNRWREETRSIFICELKDVEPKKWKWLSTIIKIERKVIYKGKTSLEKGYYISSLKKEKWAKFFWEWIRWHWWVEVFHHIKDVTMKEDDFKVKDKNVSAIYSALRNCVINIFRENFMNNIQAALEKCANRPQFMLSLLI